MGLHIGVIMKSNARRMPALYHGDTTTDRYSIHWSCQMGLPTGEGGVGIGGWDSSSGRSVGEIMKSHAMRMPALHHHHHTLTKWGYT